MAVLTYLRRILESVDHPDMINLILHYLLALPDSTSSAPATIRSSVSDARKRKSMDLATMMAATNLDVTTTTPLLFNLVDLTIACLRSHSQQTIHVTLQLVSAILKRHHRYAVVTLLHTDRVSGTGTHRTVGAHQQDLEFFMSLAGIIGGQDNFDEIYDNILKDTVVRLESHPCSLKLVAPKVSTNNHKLPAIPDTLPGAPRDVRSHTVRATDPLLNTVLDRLETFFVNPVDTNLSLTETILDLAVCGFMNIEGWLLRHPDKYLFDDDEDEDATSPQAPSSPANVDPESDAFAEFQAVQSMKQCQRRPRWAASSLPRLLSVLQTLSDQVVAYRNLIPRFDDLLQQRREAFQTADSARTNTTPARPRNAQPPTSTPDRTSTEDTRGESPARPSALEGFAQRIFSELGTPGRTGSPRGRKDSARSGGGSVLSGGYGLATPTSSKPVPVPPKDVPYETPSRSALGRSYSPGSQRGDAGSWKDSRDPLVASQIAAFQAVDQKILARRVGLPPSRKVEAIPLNFDRKPANGDGEPDGNGIGDDARSSVASENGDTTTPAGEKTVSVSHIITNAIILQSFLLEIAALVQARAGLFDEVRFA